MDFSNSRRKDTANSPTQQSKPSSGKTQEHQSKSLSPSKTASGVPAQIESAVDDMNRSQDANMPPQISVDMHESKPRYER